MFIGIARLTFMGLHLFSFSSSCYPVLITYLSSLFQILIFIAHDTMTFEFTTHTFVMMLGTPTLVIFMWFTKDGFLRAHSFLYFRVVRPLLILDMVFRVTFEDVLEEAWVHSAASKAF